MKKSTAPFVIILLAFSVYSQTINILVWSKTKKSSKYKKPISEVVADGLNKTAGITATAGLDDQSLLSKENLAKYDALYFFHATGVSSASQESIVSLVEAGKLGLVGSHDALRNNKEVRELVGMTLMYTDYFDMQEIWSVAPDHPITAGVPDTFVLDPGQPYVTFTVNPDVNMIFKGRSNKDKDLNVGWTRNPGKGRTFYFCPDHETFTNYTDSNVQKIFSNAAFWVTSRTTNTGSIISKTNRVQNMSVPNSMPWTIYFSKPKNKAARRRLYNVKGQSPGAFDLSVKTDNRADKITGSGSP